jgi:hypothetical protein
MKMLIKQIGLIFSFVLTCIAFTNVVSAQLLTDGISPSRFQIIFVIFIAPFIFIILPILVLASIITIIIIKIRKIRKKNNNKTNE